MNTERARLADEQKALAAERAKLATEQIAKFKANPLAFAKEQGVTYEDITKAAIAEASAGTADARLTKLEQERKAEREQAEKTKAEQEQQQKAQEAQGKIVAYVDGIHGTATKDEAAKAQYAMVNALEPDYAKGLIFDVADLMTRQRQEAGTFKGPQDLPTAAEVLGKIESYLEGEAEKLAKAKAAKAGAANGKGTGGAANGAGAGNGAASPAGENPEVAKMVEDQKRKAALAKTRTTPRNLTNAGTQAPAAPAKHPREGKMSPKEALAHVEQLAREGKLV